MRGRKRHRKKRRQWAKRQRYRVLLDLFKSGTIYIPSRVHEIDHTPDNEFEIQNWIARGAP